MGPFKGFSVSGDTETSYNSPEELWAELRGPAEWYQPALDYWAAQPASYDGVLAGQGGVNGTDIAGSEAFLRKACGAQLGPSLHGRPSAALDCGAGVGRVTEQLLLRHFAEVDLVEPCAHLLAEAQRRLGGLPPPAPNAPGRATAFFQEGLQSFVPESGRYNVIWLQWAMLYLTDADVLAFLERCRAALRPQGLLVVKENVCETGFVVDKEDCSLTRSHAYMQSLFQRAGWRLLLSSLQRGFPAHLFKVRMYALAPPAAAD